MGDVRSIFTKKQPKVASTCNPPEHQNIAPSGSWLAFVLASIAATALIFSALAQNVSHGWALGAATSDFRGAVLAAASAGASILGPFAWLAFLRGRGFGTRVAALVLWVGCLTYAGTCSIGFIAGANDTAREAVSKLVESHADRRALAKTARGELATLKGTRADVVERRAELTALLVKLADTTPGERPTARPDSQGRALAFYLGKAGWTVTESDVTTWLALGTVVFLEFAAALSVGVAAALKPAPRPVPIPAPVAPVLPVGPASLAPVETAASEPPAKRQDDKNDKTDPPPPSKPRGKGGRPRVVIPTEVADRLRTAGGKANGSVREIGKALGVRSKSTAHRVLQECQALGLLTVNTGPHGCAVALA